MASKITITEVGLVAGTTRDVYFKWTSGYTTSQVESFRIRVWYRQDGQGYLGTDTTVNNFEYTYQYTAPDEAEWVTIYVCAEPKTYEVNDTEYTYFSDYDWAPIKQWYFVNNRAADLSSAPTVELKDNTITASYENLDITSRAEKANSYYTDYECVEFECTIDDIVRHDLLYARVITGHAAVVFNVAPGHRYKVRAKGCYERAFTDNKAAQYVDESSNWSEYSDNITTVPVAPERIDSPQAVTETSVKLSWSASSAAETYEVEYATDSSYFDVTDQTSSKTGIEGLTWTFTGLETGNEYFFRVRAVNSTGNSGWTDIVSVNLGATPAAPTTWSSTTTCMVGETLILNWIHNSEDNSTQQYAIIEIIVDGESKTITIDSTKEADDEKTTTYSVDTSSYKEGTELQWRVSTAGVGGGFSEASIMRTVNIYAWPVLSVTVTDKDGTSLNELGELSSYPFYVKGNVSAENQKPISYHISIKSVQSYKLTDSSGEFKMVNARDEIFSKYYEISDDLSAKISAGDIRLFPQAEYEIIVTVALDSGLTTQGGHTLILKTGEEKYYPDATIAIRSSGVTASIQPHCYDDSGAIIDGLELSVYRREFDGSLREIATGIKNSNYIYITDPHPALDSARYRIVATNTATGWVDYTDLPAYPVQEKAVILQWNEQWQTLATTQAAESEDQDWTGSMLRLPYNIDVSDSYSPDVSLIEYIGRRHPVSYYGDQVGQTSTWSMDIDRTDTETLYALRRLAVYMGDVYVREPSGSGYWAQVTVSFSQTHCNVTIPVTLGIKRVEGGI
jgi:hypothetical protein